MVLPITTGKAVVAYTERPAFALLAQIGLVSATVNFVPAGMVMAVSGADGRTSVGRPLGRGQEPIRKYVVHRDPKEPGQRGGRLPDGASDVRRSGSRVAEGKTKVKRKPTERTPPKGTCILQGKMVDGRGLEPGLEPPASSLRTRYKI